MSLKIIKSLMTRQFNDDVLEILSRKFAPGFPYEHDVTVQVCLDSNMRFSASIRYEEDEPMIPGFWLSQSNSISLIEAVRKVIIDYQAMHECKHGRFERAKSKDGIEFGDGTGACTCCGAWTAPKHFEEMSHTQVIDISIQSRKKYATRHNWGDTFVQGNDYGLVLSYSDDSYTTAFFEAFPSVGEHGTFIRGEGDNMLQAEQEAWDKYQKRLKCDGHEWSRTVHGQDRDDGYAICTKCKLTATALEPLTKCHKCGKAAKRTTKNGYICDHDYSNMGFDDLLEHNIYIQNQMAEFKKASNGDGLSEHVFKAHVITTFIMAFRKAYTEAGFTFAAMRQREKRYGAKYYHLLKQHSYGVKVFHSLKKVPDYNHADVQSNYEVMERNVVKIIEQLSADSETISFSPLIEGLIENAGV